MSKLSTHMSALELKPTRAKKRAALKYYYENPTLNANIWYKLFPDEDPHISIPHYLHYIEGWDYHDFQKQFDITHTTFYNWMVTTSFRPSLRFEFEEAMDLIENPEDPEDYENALFNDDQYKPQGKIREYPPSKAVRTWCDKQMRKHGVVKAEDYPSSRNQWRTARQIHAHALSKGWKVVEFGHYTGKKGRTFNAVPMSKVAD